MPSTDDFDVTAGLRVLTFNLWGIFNSKMREERMIKFASKVGNYDIILLQEQFSPADFNLIIAKLPREVRDTRYFVRFPSSFYGSGCAVISRFPIKSTFFHTYPLQGYPEMFLHGDFFANKGAALVRIEVPIEKNGAITTQDVLLYTTHLVAIYQKVSQMVSWRRERYLPFRLSQAIALADFISNTSSPSDHIIIGGDFNSSQRSLEVQTLLILLKRRGYTLRSALPTPTPVANFISVGSGEASTSPTSGGGDAATSNTFTFTNDNPHNNSPTSYFKLLNMQSDLPAQIDHLFFNCSTMTLKPFEDCPDAAPNAPIYVEVNGVKKPSALVVMSRREVRPQQQASVCTRTAERLRQWSTFHSGCFARWARGLANVLSSAPPQGGAAAEGDASDRADAEDKEGMYPISDHYGVAARLQFRGTKAGTGGDEADMTPTVDAGTALTHDETIVLSSVIEFLELYAVKLRCQVVLSRYLAGFSVVMMGVNIWALHSLLLHQQVRSAATVEYLLTFAGERSAETLASTTPNAPTDQTNLSTQADTEKSPEAADTAADLAPVVGELLTHTMWSTVTFFTGANMFLSLIGAGSFLIGMFQRMGNANILEGQIKGVRRSE